MRSVPLREWLAVALPVFFGITLLAAGAVSAADADAWLVYALAAAIGLALPLVYTLRLAREHRLFLRSDAAVARSHRRVGTLTLVGWLLGAAVLAVLVSAGGSGTTAVYAALGGASIGLWPGLLANFIRLWREEWAPAALRKEARERSRRCE
jgi:hypothetical protein